MVRLDLIVSCEVGKNFICHKSSAFIGLYCWNKFRNNLFNRRLAVFGKQRMWFCRLFDVTCRQHLRRYESASWTLIHW